MEEQEDEEDRFECPPRGLWNLFYKAGDGIEFAFGWQEAWWPSQGVTVSVDRIRIGLELMRISGHSHRKNPVGGEGALWLGGRFNKSALLTLCNP